LILKGTGMAFELKPRIENQCIKLEPLALGDFDALYSRSKQ
jgi:hypothetical protein